MIRSIFKGDDLERVKRVKSHEEALNIADGCRAFKELAYSVIIQNWGAGIKMTLVPVRKNPLYVVMAFFELSIRPSHDFFNSSTTIIRA